MHDVNGESPWEVVVVGAGAAGLLSAARAAERGRRVLLLEKNHKPGVKILMSGGTRCNLTHATDARGIVEASDAAPTLGITYRRGGRWRMRIVMRLFRF